MGTMRRWRVAGIVLFAIGWLGAGGPGAAEAQARRLTIAAGPIGGVWYPMGGAIGEILKKQMADLSVTVIPGGGVSNLFILADGKADLVFTVTNTAAEAAHGRADFAKRPLPNVRAVAVLYPQAFHLAVLAPSDIRSVEQLRGRNLNTTQRGSSTEYTTRLVLQAHGLRYEDLKKVTHTNVNDGMDLMRDGHADGNSQLSSIPFPAYVDLGLSRGIRVLALAADKVDALLKEYPGYIRTAIPAGTYKGQEAAVPTIGTPVILASRAEVPETFIYGVAKALVEGRADLAAVHRVMAPFSAKLAAGEAGVAFHPGAVKYYREQGAM